MIEFHQQVVLANSAINNLVSFHERFLAAIDAAEKASDNIGSLSILSNTICCSCLGHNVNATHRPIAVNGKLNVLEYDFSTNWKDQNVSILRIYLQVDGVLTYDVEGNNKLCDYNNTYIQNQILVTVSWSLLKSVVFAPNEG